jgi:hypothetical protein
MERSAGLSKTALPTGPFDLMSPEAMGDFVIKLARNILGSTACTPSAPMPDPRAIVCGVRNPGLFESDSKRDVVKLQSIRACIAPDNISIAPCSPLLLPQEQSLIVGDMSLDERSCATRRRRRHLGS